jgi:hypothetical protein
MDTSAVLHLKLYPVSMRLVYIHIHIEGVRYYMVLSALLMSVCLDKWRYLDAKATLAPVL